MHRSGEPDEAMRRLLEASRRVAEPEIFREIGRVAHGLKRFDVLAEVLKKVIALDPTDVRSRVNYAGALTKIGDPKGAAEQFHVLCQMDPADPWHAINEAASLAYTGDLVPQVGNEDS
jgi:Flp pilus assembly protein TadD